MRGGFPRLFRLGLIEVFTSVATLSTSCSVFPGFSAWASLKWTAVAGRIVVAREVFPGFSAWASLKLQILQWKVQAEGRVFPGFSAWASLKSHSYAIAGSPAKCFPRLFRLGLIEVLSWFYSCGGRGGRFPRLFRLGLIEVVLLPMKSLSTDAVFPGFSAWASLKSHWQGRSAHARRARFPRLFRLGLIEV